MLGELLGGGRNAQDLVTVLPRKRNHVHYGRLAARDRSRLVDDHLSDILENLERLSRTHEDATLGGHAAAADHGERRRHTQRARVSHDEHGQRGEDRPRPIGAPGDGPRAQRPDEQRELTVEGDGYKIAVYGIPSAFLKGDPPALGNPLKKLASLKREGKKDVKPSSVEVFQRQDGMVVVYLFPLSAEISRKDTIVDFEAVIGRIVLKQSFDLQPMQFQGRLEL